jgi:hypothetical protein
MRQNTTYTFEYQIKNDAWNIDQIQKYLSRSSVVIEGILYFNLEIISQNQLQIYTSRPITDNAQIKIYRNDINRVADYLAHLQPKPSDENDLIIHAKLKGDQ